jgi:glycosyltransferase involved in cell wall biosynthesis
MKCSICISTYNKPNTLRKVLDSIFVQQIPFDFEVIVVDDGSSSSTKLICNSYPIKYIRIDRAPTYRNPSVARNVAYRAARGEVIIAQSDDVVHHSTNCVAKLVECLQPKTFVIATVINTDAAGNRVPLNADNSDYNANTILTGPQRRRPLFFLGALYREDLYAVGGNEEQFTNPGRDDVYFTDCLIEGQKLNPVYLSSVIGYHIHHPHAGTIESMQPSFATYRQLVANNQLTGHWVSSSGPWSIIERTEDVTTPNPTLPMGNAPTLK